MPKITVFSLDYDGCGDLLFKETIDHPQNKDRQKELIQARRKLENLLGQYSKNSSQVELYVGSLRQSQQHNRLGKLQNDNGDCFENYQEYCLNKGWTFRPLLYADTKNNRTPGSAIRDPHLNCIVDIKKFTFLKNQLDEIAKNYPTHEVDYYFIDDDHHNVIIPWLQSQFMQSDIANHIQIHLVKFHWNLVIKNNTQHIDQISIKKNTSPSKMTPCITASQVALSTKSIAANTYSLWNCNKGTIAAAGGLMIITAGVAYRMLYK